MQRKTGSPYAWGLLLLAVCCLCPLRSLAIDNSECFDCHGDASLTKESTDNILNTEITESLYVDEEKFDKSVHNRNGITCVDCHSDIEELNYDNDVPHKKNLKKVCCASCHEQAGEDFKNSVHMKLRTKGITMTCYACHGYHYVRQMEGASVTERENSICLKCHNPYQFHELLPSRSTHFAHVECVVCHAPDVPRHINLRIYDLVSNSYYDSNRLFKLLGTDFNQLMKVVDKDGNSILDPDEFENLTLLLRQKNIHPVFHAELVADISSIAHHVNKGTAQKTCQKCHSASSPYFNTVEVVFNRDDGTVDSYRVDRAVLETYYVKHFYLLGGTRMKLMDRIGLLILAGSACAVGLHLTARILTIPLRRKNKGEETS